ncbi:hypothetical protein SAMN05421810_102812 [Amycolatopsis arida]|uniref:Uncharacterized protein n=1 Tax=Amycolatopsis arida TaxID=587909 RepID=A0A1I5QZ34_9PSEU|nr:hypothetical protein [Amycolatopsis arida]TDX99014.1 hypothetical protein CLV69_101813 [Amycolatopsis arida]SFP51513.1 hypothetical protein SAMN05421810_102812 [Amycolatopsis arida]
MNDVRLDAWAQLDETCPVTVRVVGDEAQFLVGEIGATLSIVADEDGVRKLHAATTEAMHKIRAAAIAALPR